MGCVCLYRQNYKTTNNDVIEEVIASFDEFSSLKESFKEEKVINHLNIELNMKRQCGGVPRIQVLNSNLGSSIYKRDQ